MFNVKLFTSFRSKNFFTIGPGLPKIEKFGTTPFLEINLIESQKKFLGHAKRLGKAFLFRVFRVESTAPKLFPKNEKTNFVFSNQLLKNLREFF